MDDCADYSKFGYQTSPVAFIRRKTSMGKDYFEMTIRLGYMELLANNGFFGSLDGISFTPFLGSSLPNLPNAIKLNINTSSSYSIFIPKTICQQVHQERILNQYFKRDSTSKWHFQSKRYDEQDLTPAHPLHFRSENILYCSASFLIRAYAHSRIKDDGKYRHFVFEISKHKDKDLTVVNSLIKKNLNQLFSQQIHGFKSPPANIKKDLIEIYNGSLAGALKNKRARDAKIALKKYEARKIDLFDDDDE